MGHQRSFLELGLSAYPFEEHPPILPAADVFPEIEQILMLRVLK